MAGEIAARDSAGPGTFRQRLFDALYNMDEAMAGVRIADA